MFSSRILMLERTVIPVRVPRLWSLICFWGILCVSFCVVVICLMALCLIIYRERWSIKPPDVDLSRWSARHVVPHRQTNAGLSVQALQMYRCRFSNLKSFCSELFDVFIYSFPTFAFPILVCLTAIWCFSREQSSRVYLKKPYLPASSPCLKPQISSLKTRLAHTFRTS